jgi:hypothetical protein
LKSPSFKGAVSLPICDFRIILAKVMSLVAMTKTPPFLFLELVENGMAGFVANDPVVGVVELNLLASG